MSRPTAIRSNPRFAYARLAQYEVLPDRYTYPRPVGGLLAALRVPLVNCGWQRDAVSIYEPATQVIRT
ncbi:MAG: hypothetical protein ACLRI7_14350 [Ruthenibacterium lactatiformans]